MMPQNVRLSVVRPSIRRDPALWQNG